MPTIRNAKNLVGMRFGKLIVLRIDPKIKRKKGEHVWWECRCDCGRLCSVRSSVLIGGRKTFCSYHPRRGLRDLTGKTFGKLKVLGFDGKKQGALLWKCLCCCGAYTTKTTRLLISGISTHCGCLRGEANKKPHQTAAINSVLTTYRTGAKNRGLPWSLTRKEAIKILTDICAGCGAKNRSCSKAAGGDFYYNGIDRIDNTKGYFKSNCQTLCYPCNLSKRDYTVEDFRTRLLGVTSHQLSLAGLRIFYLNRLEDVSGTSGTGIVAVGVEFPSKKCVLEWSGKFKTDTIFDNIEQVKKIHGHEGKTEIIFGLPIGIINGCR